MDDHTHKPMNRKQRLAARQDDPREERTALDAVLIVVGLLAAVTFTSAGFVGLARMPESADGWNSGRTLIMCFGLAAVGLGLAYDRLKKRKQRG